jgi:hypothetical protein
MQLGSRVTMVRPHVTEALEDMQTCNVIITCKTYGHAAIVWLNTVAPHGCPLTGTIGRGCDPTGAMGYGALHAAEDIICYS